MDELRHRSYGMICTKVLYIILVLSLIVMKYVFQIKKLMGISVRWPGMMTITI